MQTPTYKLVKFPSKKLTELIRLPNTLTAYNSTKIAQDLTNININTNYKIITTSDIKDLYVNLPTKGMIQLTKTWLCLKDTDNSTTQQCITLL